MESPKLYKIISIVTEAEIAKMDKRSRQMTLYMEPIQPAKTISQ